MHSIIVSCLILGWATLLIAQPVLSLDESCPRLAVGVHEVITPDSKIIISIAKATSLNEDEGSYAIAESEARLEARRQLMNHISPKLKTIRLRGLVDLSLCRFQGNVYATLELDEKNMVRAAKMEQMIKDSLTENPAAK